MPLLDSHRPKRRSTKCVSVEDTNFPPLVNSARAYKFALRLSLMWLSNSNLDFILVLDSATHRTEAKLALLAQRHSRQGPSQKILSEHLDGELWPTDIVERVDAEFEKITGKTLEEARIRIVFAPHEADRAVIDEAERALLPPNEGGRGLTPADIAVISFDADLASMRTDACFGTLITQHRKGNQDVKSTSFSISYDIIDRKKLFKSEAMRWKTKLVLQFVVLANGQDYTGTGLAKVGLGTMDTTEFVEEVFGKWNKLEDPPLDDDEITEEHPNDDMDMDVDLSSLDILEQQIEHFLDFVQPRLLARITTKITHWRDLSPDQRDTGFDHFFNLVRAGLEVWNLEPEPVLIPRKTTEDAHLSTRAIASSAATASNLAPDLDRTQVQRFPRTSPYYKTQVCRANLLLS